MRAFSRRGQHHGREQARPVPPLQEGRSPRCMPGQQRLTAARVRRHLGPMGASAAQKLQPALCTAVQHTTGHRVDGRPAPGYCACSAWRPAHASMPRPPAAQSDTFQRTWPPACRLSMQADATCRHRCTWNLWVTASSLAKRLQAAMGEGGQSMRSALAHRASAPRCLAPMDTGWHSTVAAAACRTTHKRAEAQGWGVGRTESALLRRATGNMRCCTALGTVAHLRKGCFLEGMMTGAPAAQLPGSMLDPERGGWLAIRRPEPAIKQPARRAEGWAERASRHLPAAVAAAGQVRSGRHQLAGRAAIANPHVG